jgi:phage terminase Nu1 subunit (DNA packaging protein)
MTDMVDEKTIARMFEVHPRTVRRWRERGLIPAYATPTGRIRYRVAEIVAAQLAERVRKCPQMPSYAHFDDSPPSVNFGPGGIQ